jgi:hypothetical protein
MQQKVAAPKTVFLAEVMQNCKNICLLRGFVNDGLLLHMQQKVVAAK